MLLAVLVNQTSLHIPKKTGVFKSGFYVYAI
jgi:hypothetical protein